MAILINPAPAKHHKSLNFTFRIDGLTIIVKINTKIKEKSILEKTICADIHPYSESIFTNIPAVPQKKPAKSAKTMPKRFLFIKITVSYDIAKPSFCQHKKKMKDTILFDFFSVKVYYLNIYTVPGDLRHMQNNSIELQTEIISQIAKINEGKTLFALVETYGCQQNVNDSQKIMGMLSSMGYNLTEDREKADVIIFNTCAVRSHAEQKVFGNLGALKHLKAKKPSLIIGVCGCMVQQEQVKKEILKKYRHVDLIFGTFALMHFPALFRDVLLNNERISDIEESYEQTEGLPVVRDGGKKAFVSIMYGCNNFCSYCIVPYVRGRERSRKKEDILNEIKDLAKSGIKEIMLLGQNVNSYGKDIGETFSNLLYESAHIDGIKRVRFMSSHPKDMSDEVLKVMKECENIPNQLHLPLQSGSDRILKEMNRNYTFSDYERIIKKARELMPDIAVTTDIIVGFPGETEDDFDETIKALKTIKFDSIFSFIYSVREGTKAAKMEGHIKENIKKERFERLLKVQNDISYEINKKRENTYCIVLCEGESKQESDILTGRDEANKIVNFKGDKSLEGEFVKVKITKAQTWILQGEVCDE